MVRFVLQMMLIYDRLLLCSRPLPYHYNSCSSGPFRPNSQPHASLRFKERNRHPNF